MDQEDYNKLKELVKEYEEASKITEMDAAVRQIDDKLDQLATTHNFTDSEKVCPACNGSKEEDVFVCLDCWENKDQDMLGRRYA